MSELSVFVDESGDFGEYEVHSPYYIVTMVFHDQSIDISDEVERLNSQLRYMEMDEHCIHTGPIIRKEEPYTYMSIAERRRIFNRITAFFRRIDILHKSFHIEKRLTDDVVEMSGQLSREISMFIRDHYSVFQKYDTVKVYYDNGQIELNKILSSVFNALIQNVEFKKVMPKEYKLFQVADMLCTFHLISLKIQKGGLSLSEEKFFGNAKSLKKNYLKYIKTKEMR